MFRALSFVIALTLLSQTVWAFDPAVFQRQDDDSMTAAQAFLALPAAQRQQLAMEQVQPEQDTDPVWQLFLLAYLSNQPQTAEGWAQVTAAEEARGEVDSSELPTETQAYHAAMCLLQLQQPANPAIAGEKNLQFSEQRDLRDRLGNVCVGKALLAVQQPMVFQWVLGTIQNGDSPYRDTLFDTDLVLVALSPAQQEALRDALLAQYFDADQHDTGGISRFINGMDNPGFAADFVVALKLRFAKAKTEQVPALLQTLAGLEDSRASKFYWETVWGDPKRYLTVANERLMSSYVDEDEAFPDSLHDSAMERIGKGHDIRFAATYLYLLINAEGGGWGHVHSVLDSLKDWQHEVPKDAESQAVLKYVSLQAAGSYYIDAENRSLSQTLYWLEQAKVLPGEPLSWYARASGADSANAPFDEERIDQRKAFAPLRQLYDDGQLHTLVAWLEDGKKPGQPFKQLPLEVYSALVDKTVVARPWYDPVTGEALLLDDEGKLQPFDGWEGRRGAQAFTVQQITAEVETPTLRSPLAVWFAYVFDWLMNGDNTPIAMVEVAKMTQTATERLLLTPKKDMGSGVSPFLEYVRYGQHVMLNASVKGDIYQHWFTYPSEAAASQWLASLPRADVGAWETHPLWHWEMDGGHYLLTRRYKPNDADDEAILLSPLFTESGFRYETVDCGQAVEPTVLGQQTAAFSQVEARLYQQGYVLAQIEKDYDCVE